MTLFCVSGWSVSILKKPDTIRSQATVRGDIDFGMDWSGIDVAFALSAYQF